MSLALGFVLALRFLRVDVVSLGLASAGHASGQPRTVRLSVMSQNIFYGGDDYDLATGDWCPVADGCPSALRKLARIIRASGADVVGLQEAERNTTALARLLGWHADPRAQVISRFPLLRPVGGQGLYTFVEPVPGRIVAVANTHLPSTPYGPYKVQLGKSRAKVMAIEQRLRVPALDHVLRVLPRLAARGIPVFLTGDFNSPSHLDWTRAVADVRADVPYPVGWPASAALAGAGFVDSYRSVHPDPVADPGFTWTPGGPEGRAQDVFDRIDWVLSAGPAAAVSSRLVGETGNPQVDVATPGRFPTDHRGVVSTFDVAPLEAPPSVSPSERRVIVGAGSRLRVRFHGTGGAGEVVALVARSGPMGSWWSPGRPAVAPPAACRCPPHGCRPAATTWCCATPPPVETLAQSPIWVYERDTRARMTTNAEVYRPGQG